MRLGENKYDVVLLDLGLQLRKRIDRLHLMRHSGLLLSLTRVPLLLPS